MGNIVGARVASGTQDDGAGRSMQRDRDVGLSCVAVVALTLDFRVLRVLIDSVVKQSVAR